MVCLCRGVSERTVLKAIDRGASTVDEVGLDCRAGTGCGICRDTIADLLVARVSVRRHAPAPAFRAPAFAAAAGA